MIARHPTVVIIGRPNVGKSTLFNRLVGRKLALVDDTPGVTRDRREGDAMLYDLKFRIVDTAGLEEADALSLAGRMRAQTELRRRTVERVAERFRREHARTVERVDVRLDADRVIDQPARRWFVARALSAVGEAVGRAGGREPGQPGDQRRFGQALEIEHRVVALRLQARFESMPLGAHAMRPPALAPAPQRTFDDRVDTLDAP